MKQEAKIGVVVLLLLAVAVAGVLLAYPAGATSLPGTTASNDVEVAGSYESVQTIAQTFYQNASGGLWGQSTPAIFTPALPLPYSNATSVTAVLTLTAPSGYTARANVVQTPDLLYNYSVPYQVSIYGIDVRGPPVLENVVNLSSASGLAPPVGTYSVTAKLTLTLAYVQDYAAVWTPYGNDSYSYNLTLTAPSGGTLNFTTYVAGSGATVPFPVPVNLSSVAVRVAKVAYHDYQWTYGSVTILPANLAAGSSQTYEVWVTAVPVTTGAIPVLSFSTYTTVGSTEYSTVSWVNNRSSTYSGYFLIEYTLPHAVAGLTVALVGNTTAIPSSNYLVSPGVVTLLPGAVAVRPSAVLNLAIRYTFLNVPPSLSLVGGTPIAGTLLSVGDLTVVLLGLDGAYGAYVAVTGGGLSNAAIWKNRLLEVLCVGLVLVALLVLEFYPYP